MDPPGDGTAARGTGGRPVALRFVADLTQRGFVRLPGLTVDTPLPGEGDHRRWAKRFHGSMDPGRAANVHVREIGSPGWVFGLQFRDWLRANPDERERYASLKRWNAPADWL